VRTLNELHVTICEANSEMVKDIRATLSGMNSKGGSHWRAQLSKDIDKVRVFITRVLLFK
jgi:hypothetical protein